MGIKLEKVIETTKYHIVDTTALLTSTNPLYSAMEVGIAGMSDDLSIDSRITVAGLSYAGMGFAFARGRDVSRKIFGITEDSRERIQTLHDIGFTAAFNLALAPLIYLSMGADIKQAVVGGLSAGAMSAVMGPVMGYSVDTARDLTGLRECKRITYPEKVRKQRPSIKKGIGGLLIVSSIAAMAGVYALNQNNEVVDLPISSIEKVIEDSE